MFKLRSEGESRRKQVEKRGRTLTESEWPLKTCTPDSAYFTLLPALVLIVHYTVHTDSWDNGNARSSFGQQTNYSALSLLCSK